MPRAAPQIDRVVAIVNLLSGRPGGLTLTELAGDLGESSSTMVHVLAALTSAGYRVREQSDRRYHLGPALVEPGRVAADRYPGLAIARRYMTRLSQRFEAPCYAFVRDRRWARLVHYTWDPHHPVPPMRIGELIPLVPPLGAVFVAWAPAAQVDEWFDADPALSNDAVAQLRVSLARIRRLGFSVEARRDEGLGEAVFDRLQEAPSPVRDRELRRMLSAEGHLVTSIDSRATYRATAIGAPVFGASGVVELSMTVSPLDRTLSGRELRAIGHAVSAAASAVTEELAGRAP